MPTMEIERRGAVCFWHSLRRAITHLPGERFWWEINTVRHPEEHRTVSGDAELTYPESEEAEARQQRLAREASAA